MKKFKYLIIILVLITMGSCTSKRDRLSELQKTPPDNFVPPKVEIRVLGNGLKLYLIEDHTLPTVEVKVGVRTGSIYEPANKIGLAKITGEVLRTGGTKIHSGDEIDKMLGQHAVTIETDFGYEISSISLTSLTEEKDFALSMLFEILKFPAFENSKLDLAKKKELEEIRRRNDSPRKIMFREFKRIVWGKTTPWARIPFPDDINRINREDLINFHSKYFFPNNMILVASGDFEKEDFIKSIEKLSSNWKNHELIFPNVEIPTQEEQNKKPRLYLIPKDFTQSTIIMGHMGPKRHCPDEYAITIMNMILGESTFVSRLGQEVRTNLGLAYVVWSFFTDNRDLGLFVAGAMTKAQSTVLAIETMKEIIAKMHTQADIKDEELKTAKETIRNTFIFKYESKFDIARRRALLDYYDYPADYLDKYLENINKVTKQEVEEAAIKYLHPDNLFILVIGDPKELQEELKGLGIGDPVSWD